MVIMLSMYSGKPSSSEFESDYGGLVNRCSGNLDGLTETWGSRSKSQALVLDTDKGKLVKTSGRVGKKGGVSEAKTIAALKSHSEAERRRRERINAHFATLRGLVPSNEKMDKATLLGEVISQVKELQITARQASEGLHIPLDFNEVQVEQLNNSNDGSYIFRASICCDYIPSLLSDIKQSLDALNINLVKAEISTLEGRVKYVFVFTACNDRDGEVVASSVHKAFTSLLEKVAASAEYSQQILYPNKRQRISYLGSVYSS